MAKTKTKAKSPKETHVEEEKQSIIADAAFGIREGASDAGKSVGNVFSAIGRMGSKAVYGTCYGASYGVTFAALTAAGVLPETARRGFKEGAEAAEETIEHRHEKLPTETSEQPA